MQIEAGKYYRTRDGVKVGPVRMLSHGYFDVTNDALDEQSRFVWRHDGTRIPEGLFVGESIEAEWSDEPVTAAPNPKQRYGDKKPALAQLPLAGMSAQSLAHMDGDYKYGFRNWRKDPVEAVTYINAALRHLMLWAEGEEDARDTGVPNLGGVMACCAILLDAQANGTLIDNRSKSAAACDVLHDHEKKVARLREMTLDKRDESE